VSLAFPRRPRLLAFAVPVALLCALPALQHRSAATAPLAAQPPGDNVRPIPPPGIAVPDAERAELVAGLEALTKEIDALRADHKIKKEVIRYLPDVLIFEKAVRYALTYNEFYKPGEFATAKSLLKQGVERAIALKAGDAPWTRQTGLVVLGYVSRIDDSVQPYGLVVPEAWSSADRTPRRLDFFCHGRGEQLTELAFLSERQRSGGEFTPPGAFVLHPYGRYCNANRFAGETDLFEALADVQARYPVDENRVVARGFSMGGAACWQFATHHADRWAAAAPGAGFSETVGFLRLDAPGKPPLPAWEGKLLHWYDATDYATNLAQLPTVAYNGDKDGQKQAADAMEAAMAADGLKLTRVIGPETGHSYHPESKKEINSFVDAAVAKGRDTTPARIRFTTWTLRYHRLHWLTVTGLGRHWERARVEGELTDDALTLTTQNVTRFEVEKRAARKTVTVDGQKVGGTRFVRDADGKWRTDTEKPGVTLRKRPGLQGPIDDAFLERFVMVRPTGTPLNAATGAWADAEMKRAVREWRSTFRGDALVRDDRAVTKTDIRDANLVLWGEPASNALLKQIAPRLPVVWEKDGALRVNGKTYPSGTAAPVLIFPNPLNPNRYVVLNSGITWREAAYLNNAQQRPRLPDWAVIDITVPADKNAPGRVADAGFFDEEWK
jgi:dienelactone hydrolase/frataxin-like iron-binding protein CyaY